jgi:hypothetical protein
MRRTSAGVIAVLTVDARCGREDMSNRPTKGETREKRRQRERKMQVDGAGIRRVYPDAIRKRAKGKAKS